MGTENVYQVIENHVVMLSNMKSSPYYKQFDDKIDFWENNIAQITETLELLLAVQGKWSYLESIFRGPQDISKQLPQESSVFTKINTDFKIEMERINKERNAYRALIVKGFINILQDLNKKLEYIQKNLNQFLEGKRSLFPRFYFLSNDDLLEIIGQAKDPEPIQKHIKKIFEGTNTLGINKVRSGSQMQYEITTLNSQEKEVVDLRKSVLVDPRVENWLKLLLESMREALKYIFYKFWTDNMQASKKLPERDKLLKIIRATQGQVLITCAQMAWTTEVTQALIQLEATGQVNALKKARQTYKKKVENYVELVEKPGLTLLERLKLIALITIEEHNREIVERLYQLKIQSPRHFEWL
jgi:dynein heavy chain